MTRVFVIQNHMCAALLVLAAFANAGDSKPDFDRDVLPLLKKNCIACHSTKKAESDLVLETVATMRKGGEGGPAIVPGKSSESLLIKAVTGKTDMIMPPKKNKVGAVPLKSDEISLIKKWIDSGAGGGTGEGAGPVSWRPLPSSWNPIYAVAITSNGQYAACARANQIFVYHLPTGQQTAILRDPALGSDENPIADRDIIECLAFSPDGTLLASGGYRNVKLWRRQPWSAESKIDCGPLTVFATSADGKLIAAAGEKTIKLFDTSGKLLKEIAAHSGEITALKFSPDSSRLCSGSADKTVAIWDAGTGDGIAKAETPAPVLSVTWLGDGKRVASGGADNLIRIWQLPDGSGGALTPGKELKGHTGPVNALDTIWPDGVKILSGSADGSVQQWDVDKANSTKKYDHGGPVLAIAVRKDGKRFASAGANKLAKLWNPDGNAIATLKGDRRAQEATDDLDRTAAFAKDEVAYHKNLLQSAEKQQKADAEALKKITDTKAAAETALKQKKEAHAKAAQEKEAGAKTYAEPIAALKKAADAKEAADKAAAQAASDLKAAKDKASQAKNALNQANDAKQKADKAVADLGSKAKPNDAKAAKDKAEAAKNAVTQAETAKAAADKAVTDAEAKSKSVEDAKSLAAKVRDDLATQHKDANEKWKAIEKAAVDSERAEKDAEHALEVAVQNLARLTDVLKGSDQALASAKSESERWEAQQKSADAALEAAKKALADSEKTISSVAFSPDGAALLTSGEDGMLRFWSTDNGAAGEIIQAGGSAAFLPDGRAISADPKTGISIWHTAAEWKLERALGTGDEKSIFSDRVLALDFSGDGKQLATGGGIPAKSGEIKIFDTANGNIIRDQKDAHSDAVFGLSFSADGKTLASCGADKFIKLWNAEDGKLRKQLEGHTHHVLGVSWKRDGRLIASCGADKTCKIWDLVTGEQKKTMEGYKKEVTSVHYIDNRNEILLSSGDSQVRTVKEDGGGIRGYKTNGEYVQSAAVTPDGKFVVSGGQDGVLRVFEGPSSKSLRNFDPPKIDKPKAAK